MLLLIDGIEKHVYQSQEGYWMAQWLEEGKRKSQSFGKNDPTVLYPVLNERKYGRKATKYAFLDGHWMTLYLVFQKCRRTSCECHQGKEKHGPYWKGHYREGNRLHVKYLGKELPVGLIDEE